MNKLEIKRGVEHARSAKQFRQALLPAVELINELSEKGEHLEAAGLLGFVQRHGKRFDILHIDGVDEPEMPDVALSDPWKGNTPLPEPEPMGSHWTNQGLRNLSSQQRAQVAQRPQHARNDAQAPNHTAKPQSAP